jgi:hypothetical protein
VDKPKTQTEIVMGLTQKIRKNLTFSEVFYFFILSGTKGLIILNHNGGIKLNRIDAGYPKGNVGLSSKLIKSWYFFEAL